MNRVQKWLDDHKCVKANFDGCRLGLVNSDNVPVKKPWTVATTMPHLVQQLDHLVHKAFLNHCTERQKSHSAAVAISALKHSAFYPTPIAEIMASSGSASSVTRGAGDFPLPPQTVSRELIDQTNELFVKALKDLSLAETMVIPATMEVLSATRGGRSVTPEPAADAPPNEIYIGNIPNYQWLELREEFPNVT